MTRDTYRSLEAVSAVCQGCPWRSDARNALGTAAQHHDRTGHVVITELINRVTYGDADEARRAAGQTTIEEALTP